MSHGRHVTTGHKSDYSIAYSGKDTVQIVETAQDHVHWLIVRDGTTEQKIALSLTGLMLLCEAVSIHPIFKRAVEEREK